MSKSFDELYEEYGRQKAQLAAKVQLKIIKEETPSKLFVPNKGQWKLMEALEKCEELPFVIAHLSGNGVGKTCEMANLLVGMIWGPDLLHDQWLRKADFWKWIRPQPRLRIVSHADDMKDGGSMLEEIKKWFPKGRYNLKKGGKSYVSSVECDNGIKIDVKTHDQDATAHAGSNLDYILFNEPPPEHVYSESVGRLRGGGALWFFMTPLSVSAWLHDQVLEHEDGAEKIIVMASIWDNCADIKGTRGVLRKKDIDRLITEWNISDPDEAEARETGMFKHLTGRVYKSFNQDVHVVEPFEIPENWPIYHVIDPHDARAPAVGWFAQDPMNNFYCIEEYPVKDYTKMKGTEMTIPQFCNAFRSIENGWETQVKYRRIDPNKGPYKYRNTNRSVIQEYKQGGYNFRCDMVKDDLEYGHAKVRELIFYDKRKEVDDFNRPRLYFFDRCHNTIQAMNKYSLRPDAKTGKSLATQLDQKYKDFADVVRYFAVSVRPYQSPSAMGGQATYAAIDKARSRWAD